MANDLALRASTAPAPAREVLPARLRFPTRAARDAAIVECAVRGMPPYKIEAAIEVTRSVIYTVTRTARLRGVAIPFFKTSGEPQNAYRAAAARTVVVPAELLDRLEEPARRRGLSAVGLAREIIRSVVDEGMIDAVLDDGGEAD